MLNQRRIIALTSTHQRGIEGGLLSAEALLKSLRQPRYWMLPSREFEISHPARNPDALKDEVLSELQTILDSAAFRTSQRAREFLSYVVHEALEGKGEALKERSIGINLYHRHPTYVTGDDPVVRVKAGEVRRRLHKYYGENPAPGLRIELPLGSYVPHFLGQANAATELEPPADLTDLVPNDTGNKLTSSAAVAKPKRKLWEHPKVALAALVAIGAIATLIALRPTSSLRRFWAPLLSDRTPVLVSIPAPVAYALSTDVAKRFNRKPTSLHDSQLAMNTTPIPLDPDAVIKGNEITPLVEYSVNKDDAYALAEVSKVFARLGQNAQPRIGKDLTFADLRSSPAVLIGAFNNPWTLKMSSDLPYRFKEDGILPLIEDKTNPARTWRPEPQGRLGSRDFAIVARLLNSETGQPIVIIAGTGMVGTEAAGHTLCNEETLKRLTAGLPKDWGNKNLEIVLETDQVDGSSASPHVVASSTW